ncbi:MAG: hcrC [Burkholderia sp.]|jgi:carbon-monoxide dehydrogenase small subunit|nr:hcrC [Burkholderia sp.]
MSSSNVKKSIRINGRAIDIDVPVNVMLVDFLRDTLDLKGTKIGCSRGVCGSCTVLIDGVPRAACSTFTFQAAGRDVTTIEGLQRNGELDPVQRAFIENSAFQCGYCTAGMIMLAKALLDMHPDPTREQIVEWMSSNICRCTGYLMIVEAVENAAKALREATT